MDITASMTGEKRGVTATAMAQGIVQERRYDRRVLQGAILRGDTFYFKYNALGGYSALLRQRREEQFASSTFFSRSYLRLLIILSRE